MPGNLQMQRLLRAHPDLQAETEAEQVADQILHGHGPPHAAALARIGGPRMQRMCDQCAEEEQPVLAKRESPHHNKPRASGEHQAAAPRNQGQPLPASVRSYFEPRFGADFSRVRIHTDATAQQSARSLHALAYTLGDHIVFASGHYSPATTEGKHLLAHELVHVLQQQTSGPALQRQDDSSAGGGDGDLGCECNFERAVADHYSDEATRARFRSETYRAGAKAALITGAISCLSIPLTTYAGLGGCALFIGAAGAFELHAYLQAQKSEEMFEQYMHWQREYQDCVDRCAKVT
jgi:hypothetical protein